MVKRNHFLDAIFFVCKHNGACKLRIFERHALPHHILPHQSLTAIESVSLPDSSWKILQSASKQAVAQYQKGRLSSNYRTRCTALCRSCHAAWEEMHNR